MDKVIKAFTCVPIYNVPDVYEYLKWKSNGLRIWMVDTIEDVEKFSEATRNKSNGDFLTMPVSQRIEYTFPSAPLKFVIIYGAKDYWTYFFLPYEGDVRLNDMLYKFLFIAQKICDEDTGTFLDQLKEFGFDLNSVDNFTNLMEVNRKVCELRDKLPLCMRRSVHHTTYSSWRKELSIEHIKQQMK